MSFCKPHGPTASTVAALLLSMYLSGCGGSTG